MFGNIYETFCLSEIIKQNYNHKFHIDFYYWRDKQGNEVDVVYENNGLNVVEIKSSMTINKDDGKNLLIFEKLAGKKLNKKIIYLSQKIRRYKDFTINDWTSILV